MPNRKYVALQVYMTAHSCRKLEKLLREQGVGKPKNGCLLGARFSRRPSWDQARAG